MARLTAKEREIVEACVFQPHYSGKQSQKFWKEVVAAGNDRVLYDFGCALQDIESRLLRVVNEGVRVRAMKLVAAQRLRRGGNRRKKSTIGLPSKS
jgi:hypothetical protein